MSRRSLAARIGAQTTTGGVVVVADPHQHRLLEDKHRRAGSPPGPAGLGRRPQPPRSTGHTRDLRDTPPAAPQRPRAPAAAPGPPRPPAARRSVVTESVPTAA